MTPTPFTAPGTARPPSVRRQRMEPAAAAGQSPEPMASRWCSSSDSRPTSSWWTYRASPRRDPPWSPWSAETHPPRVRSRERQRSPWSAGPPPARPVAGPAGLVLLGALRPADGARGRASDPGDADCRVRRADQGASIKRTFAVPVRNIPSSRPTGAQGSDQAMLITGANMESPAEGTDPVLMTFQQYPLETRYGRS